MESSEEWGIKSQNAIKIFITNNWENMAQIYRNGTNYRESIFKRKISKALFLDLLSL